MKNTIAAMTLVLFLLSGCSKEKSETTTSGNLHILIPESVAPVALDEVKEFLNLYQSDGANIGFQIVTSDQALSRLNRDSVRFVFSTRAMTPAERQSLPESGSSELTEVLIAYDAIVVVVSDRNRAAKMTTEELEKILAGQITKWEQLSSSGGMKGLIELVLQDSSDVTSFIHARLLKEKPICTNAIRTSSSIATIQTVAAKPLAIGMAGVTWVDSAHAPVKVLEIAEMRQSADTTFPVAAQAIGKFYSPHPANIYRSYYPLKRALYAYWYGPLKSLASGFGAYVSHADGQKLFLKRNMVPGTQKIRLRGTEQEH